MTKTLKSDQQPEYVFRQLCDDVKTDDTVQRGQTATTLVIRVFQKCDKR